MTLIQTKRIKPFPVILVGSEYWNGLWDWIRNNLLERKLIFSEDMDLVTILDDPDEIARAVRRVVIV